MQVLSGTGFPLLRRICCPLGLACCRSRTSPDPTLCNRVCSFAHSFIVPPRSASTSKRRCTCTITCTTMNSRTAPTRTSRSPETVCQSFFPFTFPPPLQYGTMLAHKLGLPEFSEYLRGQGVVSFPVQLLDPTLSIPRLFCQVPPPPLRLVCAENECRALAPCRQQHRRRSRPANFPALCVLCVCAVVRVLLGRPSGVSCPGPMLLRQTGPR